MASGVVSVRPRHTILPALSMTQIDVSCFLAWTRGQPPNRHVFQRDDGGVWGPSHQQRPLEQASRLAQISPPVTFHVLRHTHASQLAMRGVPMAVIAKQLGHADTRMTEKHYAHLAPNYVADTIRANFPNLGIGETLKVVPLRVAGKLAEGLVAVSSIAPDVKFRPSAMSVRRRTGRGGEAGIKGAVAVQERVNDAYWSLAMALAWITYRTEQAVINIKGDTGWAPTEAAIRDLLSALRPGKLIAHGMFEGERIPHPIETAVSVVLLRSLSNR